MDTLAKYSYYVFGHQVIAEGKAMQTVEGTCFFVSANDRLFLVSAKHLMTSWNSADAEKQLPYPDTLFVRVPADSKKGYTDLPIDIREIKKNVDGDFYYREPDVFIMPFIDTLANSISALTLTDIENISVQPNATTLIHGFPSADSASLSGNVYSALTENISYHDNQRGVDVRDTINYLVKCKGTVRGGFSGAPVFIRENSQWIFGGLVSQGVPVGDYFFVLKPGHIIDLIRQQLLL